MSQGVDNKHFNFLFRNFTVKVRNYVGAWTQKRCSWLMPFSTDCHYRGAVRTTVPQHTTGLPPRKRIQSVQQTGSLPDSWLWPLIRPSAFNVPSVQPPGPNREAKETIHNIASHYNNQVYFWTLHNIYCLTVAWLIYIDQMKFVNTVPNSFNCWCCSLVQGIGKTVATI